MCYFEVLEGRRHKEAPGDGQNAGTVGVVLALINAEPCGWGLAFLTEAAVVRRAPEDRLWVWFSVVQGFLCVSEAHFPFLPTGGNSLAPRLL